MSPKAGAATPTAYTSQPWRLCMCAVCWTAADSTGNPYQDSLSPFPSFLVEGKIRFYNHLAIRSIGTHTHPVPDEKLSLRLNRQEIR